MTKVGLLAIAKIYDLRIASKGLEEIRSTVQFAVAKDSGERIRIHKQKAPQEIDVSPSEDCPKNRSAKSVLHWLISAPTPYETGVRLDYLVQVYPTMTDYLENLRRCREHWASWSFIWAHDFSLRSSTLSEQLHNSIKKKLKQRTLISCKDLPNFLYQVMMDKKLNKGNKIPYIHLRISDSTFLVNILGEAACTFMKTYMSDIGTETNISSGFSD
jgi:hypothetical protein